MWELDYKESWAPKNWCFWTVVLEKTLESPLDCKEIQIVHPKGNQSDYSLEGLMLKLKLQYFGHLMQSTDPFEKILRLGKIEGMRRRGRQRMRWLDDIADSMTWVWVRSGSLGDGQGSSACCSQQGCKESDTTERLNWTALYVGKWKTWWGPRGITTFSSMFCSAIHFSSLMVRQVVWDEKSHSIIWDSLSSCQHME